MMVRQETLLEAKGISWSVDDQSILHDIHFTIQRGSFVGLIGPNGAGKSSLMRCLYGVNQPDSGQIVFEDKNIWQTRPKDNAKKIAVILQEQSEHLGLSVYEVVALALTPHKKLFEWDNAEDRQRIRTVLQEHDLQPLKNRLFAHLSGGEKQRVMLARAMLQQPKLLIMDEPTNHLDVHYQLDVLQKVKQRVKAEQLTVLASFHDLNLAAAFCDQIIVMQEGRISAVGTPDEVLTEAMISEVFQTCAWVDRHPLDPHPRITYGYHHV
jgi:iron complex transport system ATP-binding protein